jgi:hypothetical protein
MIKLKSGIYKKYNHSLKETVLEFVASLTKEPRNHLPHIYKYDSNHNEWRGVNPKNVFVEISDKTIKTPMFTAYKIPQGGVVCLYTGTDQYEYDYETKIHYYLTVEDYLKAVTQGEGE